jgi:hypothetical protein
MPQNWLWKEVKYYLKVLRDVPLGTKELKLGIVDLVGTILLRRTSRKE